MRDHLPGHDPRAVATSGPNAGQPQPNLAGVYDNQVVHNDAMGNGASNSNITVVGHNRYANVTNPYAAIPPGPIKARIPAAGRRR